jgi:hypothetical protein
MFQIKRLKNSALQHPKITFNGCIKNQHQTSTDEAKANYF